EHDRRKREQHACAAMSGVLMPARTPPSYLHFDKAAYPWKPGIDYRARPKRYCVGKGEQGVLICEPYKSEIAPHWRFKTSAIAKRSARLIYKMFIAYLDDDDFVGADMARKFFKMGYTRARTIAGDRTRNLAAAARLDADISAHGLGDRVAVLGAVPPERVIELCLGSDLFVLASRFEGYGMAL